MSDSTPEQEIVDPSSADDGENAGVGADALESGSESATEVQSPDFQELSAKTNKNSEKTADMSRFQEVQVSVAAELGRTSVAINELLTLTEGSVFELNRSISAPIELVAQGIPLGNGEVVVVDDTFAIRIKEIYANPT